MTYETAVEKEVTHKECKASLRPILDAMETLNGRWKMPILLSLIMGPKRFKEITHDVHGISDKVLSKELKDLQTNQLIQKQAVDDFGILFQYSITEHGRSLEKIIFELAEWGSIHRNKIIGK